MKKMKTKQYVVVTTDKDRRGVFGGFLKSYDPATQIAKLTEARIALYWSAETKGVFGLAAIGPQDGSRVSHAVPEIEVNGVTAVINCTDEAVKQWEKGIWN
jgi:hypothetical protein